MCTLMENNCCITEELIFINKSSSKIFGTSACNAQLLKENDYPELHFTINSS